MNRRSFLKVTGSAFAALAASGCVVRPTGERFFMAPTAYGALQPDPEGLLDLPENFTYRVVSSLGDRMSDGASVPDKADGMGCFDLGDGQLALVRNHEFVSTDDSGGAFAMGFGSKDGGFVPGGPTQDRKRGD